MKTLVTANQKGGVGKTATVVNLAFDFWINKKKRVLLIDLDTQANASYTLNKYAFSDLSSSELFLPEINNFNKIIDKRTNALNYLTVIPADPQLANIEKIPTNEAVLHFKNNIKKLSNFYDILLVDTAPSLGITMATALYSADYVLSPIEMETYSIQGISKMMTTIANVKKVNKDLKFLGMLPSKFDSRSPRQKRHLEDLTNAYKDLLIPTKIGLRGSIADSLAKGVPIWEIKKTAARMAAKEIKKTADHIFNSITK